ncbi:hypothetical protein HaLaN_18515 [Haematococcus lacustris]|uniref:Uncharacterized protein n=1 Tax=Haematococcus lacustris TaxID=44745 RepID=A0A699ZYV3_HAELA|nr:hypothetical protein HaLaN_18515 [Haematococcus lacustris]
MAQVTGHGSIGGRCPNFARRASPLRVVASALGAQTPPPSPHATPSCFTGARGQEGCGRGIANDLSSGTGPHVMFWSALLTDTYSDLLVEGLAPRQWCRREAH